MKRQMTDFTSFPKPGEILKEVVHGPMAQYLTPEQKIQNRALADAFLAEKKKKAEEQNFIDEQNARNRRMLRNAEIATRAREENAKRAEAERRLREQNLYQDSFKKRFLNKIKGLPEIGGVEGKRCIFNSETEFVLVFDCFKQPNISFDWLVLLSEALCTRKINFLGVASVGGCDSCGYGTNHTVKIKCSDCVI